MEPPPSTGVVGAVQGAVASLAKGAKSVATAVLPTSVTGATLSTPGAAAAVGAQPESTGVLASGGRRRKTRKHRKSHKKTRKHHRKH